MERKAWFSRGLHCFALAYKVLPSIGPILYQELLQERRRERDKENQRQKESLRQMETSLSAKEKIYKERINGLEGQVDVLKDQLSKEMRRRQTLIQGTRTIKSSFLLVELFWNKLRNRNLIGQQLRGRGQAS